jgi:hypothetical protein
LLSQYMASEFPTTSSVGGSAGLNSDTLGNASQFATPIANQQHASAIG